MILSTRSASKSLLRTVNKFSNEVITWTLYKSDESFEGFFVVVFF